MGYSGKIIVPKNRRGSCYDMQNDFQLFEFVSQPSIQSNDCLCQNQHQDDYRSRHRSRDFNNMLIFLAGVATASIGWYFFGLYMTKREEQLSAQRSVAQRVPSIVRAT